jgi:hypothetical protein
MWEIGNISRYINFMLRVLYSHGETPPLSVAYRGGLGGFKTLPPEIPKF